MWVTPSAAGGGRGRSYGWSSRVCALCLCAASWAHLRPLAAQDADYSARGRAVQSAGQATNLSPSEARNLDQHMGASFSYVESLPGVVPVFSGVPYLIVRGATPAGSLSLYDGIPVPALFHVALGPSLIDPELSEDTRFFAAVAPAQYAAHVGGVIERTGPDPERLHTASRSLQLSLLDTAGLLKVPVGSSTLAIAFRYGNPGMMLRLVQPQYALDYHDFQVRYETDAAARTRWTVVLLGAGDHLGERSTPSDDISMTFQRLMARVVTRRANLQLGSQLVLSHDDSTLGQEIRGRALRASEAMYLQWSDDTWRVRAGAELSSALAQLERGTEDSGTASSPLGRSRALALAPQDFLEGQPFSHVPTRNFINAHTELHFTPWRQLHIEAGLRADGFLAGSHLDAALSPMLRLTAWPTQSVSLHAGVALTHRPRTSPIPIAGLNDIALDRGLESSLQTELGSTIALGDIAQLQATVFYNRYRDTVYMELILDCSGNTDIEAVPPGLVGITSRAASICQSSGLPTASGESYGFELFLKRNLTQYLSGFLSYTLGFASATARDGTAFTPQADVRHLLNAVLQYDFGHGFQLSARLHYRTGKMATNTAFDLRTFRPERIQERLPDFLRLDVRASYAFRVPFGRMEISAGVQNTTASQEATKRDCPTYDPTTQAPSCVVDYQPAIILPNLGVRADF